MNGMGTHQSACMQKDEWLTPKNIIDDLGVFDLDVCAPIVRPWDTAREHYTKENDGLSQCWNGYVWCNPPYGRETGKWLSKMSTHDMGIALIFARTDTKMFFEHVWNSASSLLFVEGRLFFHHVDGKRARSNSGAPSVLVAYGSYATKRLFESGINGKFISLIS